MTDREKLIDNLRRFANAANPGVFCDSAYLAHLLTRAAAALEEDGRDVELGRMVRAMPNQESLYHFCDGRWGNRKFARTDYATPEAALRAALDERSER